MISFKKAAREVHAPQTMPTSEGLAAYCAAMGAYTDQAVKQAFATMKDTLCVIAVGSYGRGEMLLHSDVDLLILTQDSRVPEGFEALVAALWSAGLRIGHSVHTPVSAVAAMRKDITVLTNFLHPRYVCGDKKLADALARQLRRFRVEPEVTAHVDALFAHRDARHLRSSDSRFLLEPHVKDGKGGLRDAQMLGWAAYLAFDVHDLTMPQRKAFWLKSSAEDYASAYRFLLLIRGCLHVLYGRAEERLSFDAQLRIAKILGYAGESPEKKAQSFMADYFEASTHIGECTRTLCTALDRAHRRTPAFSLAEHLVLPDGLCMRDGRVSMVSMRAPAAQLLQVFACACRMGRDVHPEVMAWIAAHKKDLRHYFSSVPQAAYPLRDILLARAPDMVLRCLQEAGVLGAIIPEFDHVFGMMQYDGYHTFTVDAHILLVIANVHALERGKFAHDAPVTTKAAVDLVNRRALYVAALCHDLAKGTGGHHQDKGASIAMRVGAMIGLGDSECELAAWLVKHHQHLSDVAFKRDIEDPETLAALVTQVQSPERLRLLLVLTVADMRAVGPNIWNAWKASVLRRLFERAMQAMGVMLSSAQHYPKAEATLITPQERATLEHAHNTVQYEVQHALAATKVSVVAEYQKNLLRSVAGACSMMGANIVAARTLLLDDRYCRVMLTLQNSRGEAFDEPARLAQLGSQIRAHTLSECSFAEALKSKRFVRAQPLNIHSPAAIFFDYQSSSSATLVEINTTDRSGLLYDILGVFEAENIQVSGAYIATYGQNVVDVFYIKDRFGLPFKSAQAQQRIYAALQTLLAAS